MAHGAPFGSRTAALCLLVLVSVLGLPVAPAGGAEPPKELLGAKVDLAVRWNRYSDGGSSRRGRLEVHLQGTLRLNQEFSSLEQGLPAVMVPYRVESMRGRWAYEDVYTGAADRPCGNPELRYQDQGILTVDAYPGPGNLMLHLMGDMSEQLAAVRGMAPPGAFDALVDRYLFGVTLPKVEAKGVKRSDHPPCSDVDVSRTILGGDKIEISFKFNDDGTMSGHRTWSSEADPSAWVQVSNLPAVFNARPFAPAEAPGGDVDFDLGWEIKEPSLARILLETELPSGERAWQDITDGEAEVTVGKRLRFKGAVLPDGKVKAPAGDWTLEGDGGGKHPPYFTKYDADPDHGRVIELDRASDLEGKQMITLFWSGGREGTVRFTTRATGEEMTAEAKLKVIRPRYRVDVEAKPGSTIGPAYTGGALNEDCFGEGAQGAVKKYTWWLQSNGITFHADNQDRGRIDGEEQWVQILRNHDWCTAFDDWHTSHQFVTDALDACYPYERGPDAMDRPGVPLGTGPDQPIVEEHEESIGGTIGKTTGTLSFTKVVQDCRMVLMFRPKGREADTQWVPLQEVLWAWTASAERSGAFGDMEGWKSLTSTMSPAGPAARETDEFPEWEKNAADITTSEIDGSCP